MDKINHRGRDCKTYKKHYVSLPYSRGFQESIPDVFVEEDVFLDLMSECILYFCEDIDQKLDILKICVITYNLVNSVFCNR